MLEAGGVGGVTGNGNANLFQLHNCNAFRHIVSTVAFYVSTGAIGIRRFADHLHLLGVRIKFCLYISKAVDSGNDERSVFAKTVQDNPQGLFTYFIGVQCNFNSAFRSSKRLMTSQEAEAVRLDRKSVV